MTHIITIETQSDNDFALLKGLAQRLGLPIKEVHKEVGGLSEAEELKLLESVSGSWEGDETGDELNAMIHNSRDDSPREMESAISTNVDKKSFFTPRSLASRFEFSINDAIVFFHSIGISVNYENYDSLEINISKYDQIYTQAIAYISDLERKYDEEQDKYWEYLDAEVEELLKPSWAEEIIEAINNNRKESSHPDAEAIIMNAIQNGDGDLYGF